MSHKNKRRLYPFFHLLFELYFLSHLYVRSYCIRTLVSVLLVKGRMIREVERQGGEAVKLINLWAIHVWFRRQMHFTWTWWCWKCGTYWANSIYQPVQCCTLYLKQWFLKRFHGFPRSFFFILLHAALHLPICSILFRSFLSHSISSLLEYIPRCFDCCKHLEVFDEVSIFVGLTR